MNWQNQTIGTLLDFLAQEHGEKLAVIHASRRLTFSKLKEQAHCLARGFLELGINKGDKLALLLPNRLEWTLAQLAAGLIGAIVVPINTGFQYSEFEFVVVNANAKALIVSESLSNVSFIDLARHFCELNPGKLGVVIGVGFRENPLTGLTVEYQHFEAVMTKGKSVTSNLPKVGREDYTMMMFTSGTTSFPKGVCLRPKGYLYNSFLFGERQNLKPGDRIFLTAPLFGVFAGGFGTFAAFTHGAGIVLLDGFERYKAVELIVQERCTGIYGIPAAYYAMAKTLAERGNQNSLKDIVRMVYIPTASQNDADQIKANFGGKTFINGYGSTEAGLITATSWRDPWAKIGSLGRVMEGFDLVLKTPEGVRVTNPGELGEICVKGVSVFKEYYEMPEETSRVFDAESYFHTGDLAVFDADGFFWFHGRIKDMYKYKAYSVSCAEVEAIIKEIPGVVQAAVVSIASKRYGEIGIAFVHRDEGASLGEEELREFLSQRLSEFKLPAAIRFIDNVPVTAGTGKVQKQQLKAQAELEFGDF